MYKNFSFLSLVAARNGSKGLRNKNVINLCGKPLVQWTIEASKKSKIIDHTLVSTDSVKIINLSKKLNIDAPFKRPKHLCKSTSSIEKVVKHSVDWAKKNIQTKFDFLILLQPTSPLRTSIDIDKAIKYYFKNSKNYSETMVSVYKAPRKVGWIMTRNKKYISFVLKKTRNRKVHLRQKVENYFLPNGAIYFCNLNKFKGNFYTNKTFFYEMELEKSVDIDDKNDYEIAKKIMIKGLKNGSAKR